MVSVAQLFSPILDPGNAIYLSKGKRGEGAIQLKLMETQPTLPVPKHGRGGDVSCAIFVQKCVKDASRESSRANAVKIFRKKSGSARIPS